MLTYPNIDPVIVSLGFLEVRWYSMAYIVGLLAGWWYLKWMNNKTQALTKPQYDSILTWAIFGVVLGGRLGYVLFYKPLYFLQHPLEILAVWEGGMSFHGGMIGTILAIYWFTRLNKIPFFKVMDMAAAASPIGLFLGRVANFINQELWGRPTTSAVGMIFPNDPSQLPRHPSQLYEAGMEGLLFGLILYIAFRMGAWRRPRLISALFLLFYALFRVISEFFREPDSHLGFLYAGATMGQVLCVPMVLLGVYLLINAKPDTARNKK